MGDFIRKSQISNISWNTSFNCRNQNRTGLSFTPSPLLTKRRIWIYWDYANL